MVRDFVHDPAAHYDYTILELTQYLRQIGAERFFQHADMFDHRVTRVYRRFSFAGNRHTTSWASRASRASTAALIAQP